MTAEESNGLSTLEYHVLLALASGPLHGYAIKDAVAAESSGTLTPRAGSLYRVIARLMTSGLVIETDRAPTRRRIPDSRENTTGSRARAARRSPPKRVVSKRAAAVAEKRLGVASRAGRESVRCAQWSAVFRRRSASGSATT